MQRSQANSSANSSAQAKQTAASGGSAQTAANSQANPASQASQNIGGGAGASSSNQQNILQQAGSFERTIHFSQAQALIWEVKYAINQITSKKALTTASNELESLSSKFGRDFDKYLLRELIEQIDLKDPVKAQKDKNEPFKVQLLTQEFNRCIQKPEFLTYFGEIVTHTFNDRISDFFSELTRRLKPASFTSQLILALSLVESCKEELQTEAIKILKAKLQEYLNVGRPEPNFPEYALHRILLLYSTHPEMDENRDTITQYLVDSNPIKSTSHLSMRCALLQDLMFANTSLDDPSISLTREGNGIDNLDKSYKMLEPWQLLNDLGHFASYNYSYLLKILEDFKDINEKTMACTLINLSINHTGQDDSASKIAQNTFEANKKSDSTLLKKDVIDKKNQIQWSVDNLVRAFRELFSHLNWQKVFEALSEITEDIALDAKAFSMFLQITNKSKPQNLPYPLPLILQSQWASPMLQLSFIENSIQFYIEKKEKSIYFLKAGERRQEQIDELTGIKEKVSAEFLHVWLSVDLVERLILLSDTHYFSKVRQLFEAPLKQAPEYLLLTLSLCKPNRGVLMLDELLSLLLPQFLGNHINSILVLQALWRNNQELMIRSICELCRHDQRIMNLSRVLDITQEVKESLMPIVDCEDYYFAVNLAILAGKRDFLHYDVWLGRRIQEVGTPFIKALLKYIKEHIISPISEYQKRTADATADQLETFKQQVLERSHLSKEKLCITFENLCDLRNQTNPKIKPETLLYIKEVITKLGEFFPNQIGQAQSSDEIDNAANDFFQRVFAAEPQQVDQKIGELIEIMQKFRSSEVKKEQEIYACMLHSLFDEYRFLHKYPTQYLEKIAKLYGAIIKNRIIDGTLQEIALKFVVEAFRREGKRMKFGVIVVRQIIDLLPQFPQFFEGIYEMRHNFQGQDAALVEKIEELYAATLAKNTSRTRFSSQISDDRVEDLITTKIKSTFSSFTADSFDSQASDRKEESKLGVVMGKDKAKAESIPSMPKINENDFLATFQQNQQQTNVPQQVQAPQQPVAAPTHGSKKDKKNAQEQKGGVLGQQTFNPTYKVRGSTQNEQAQIQASQIPSFQPTISDLGQIPSGSSTQGLNPSSVAFSRKVTTNQSQQPSVQQTISPFGAQQPLIPQQAIQPSTSAATKNIINVQPFRPTALRSGTPGAPQTSLTPSGMHQHLLPQPNQQYPQALVPQSQQPFNQEYYQIQLEIEQKLQKALQEKVKVRLEDIIEDSNMPGSNLVEELRLLCNQTGKGNFPQKLEELKGIINRNSAVNLPYMINYFITKRLPQATQNSTAFINYSVDFIRQIGIKDSVSMAIQAVVDIFRKCMLINEDLLNQVVNRGAGGQMSLIKQYLNLLGNFLGLLTVANNRPIYAKELDIKQLLVEGFSTEKMKYVITFVCRILRECQRSLVFKHQNPWVKANLEILKEIYDWGIQNNQSTSNADIIMEIDSLFKTFNINHANEIAHTGFLKAAINSSFNNQSQQIEVMHMMGKQKLIPAVQPPLQQIQAQQQQQQIIPGMPQNDQYFRTPSASPSPSLGVFSGSPFPNAGFIGGGQSEVHTQQSYQNLLADIFQKVIITQDFLSLLGFNFNQVQPTFEQNLRKMLADAVDQSIYEILPPVVDRSVTIALITTRELVLKDFAFDSNYNKILNAANLIVQNLAGSLALVTCREPLKMQLTTNLKKTIEKQLPQALQNQHFDLANINENLIQDLASQASKDNLDLGCKMIKKAVIQRALTKVREDPQITRAIEIRKRAVNQAEFRKAYIDESLIAQFSDLPQQLKPNEDGLSDAQFQVYEDFANLSKNISYGGGNIGSMHSSIFSDPSVSSINNNSNQFTLEPNEDIEAYLKQFETIPNFDKNFEKQLLIKLQHMIQRPDRSFEQIKKLMQFCENLFQSVCERLSQQPLQVTNQEKIVKILDFLSFVSLNLKSQGPQDIDLQERLTKNFLGMDASSNNNTQLTLTLMRRGILSSQLWDSQISAYIREQQHLTLSQHMRDLFVFLKEFLEATQASQANGNVSFLNFPNVLMIIQKLAENDSNLARSFGNVIQDHRQKTVWTAEIIHEYFNEWAVISLDHGNDPQRQEQEVNRFFNNLKEQGLYKDAKVLQKFCRAMIEMSVQRALYMNDGQTKRPSDRPVYRYIDCFLNLVVLSLMTSSSETINKHEFIAQLFDAVYQVLDEDHSSKKGDFNQKPYYRLLINILRVMNEPNIFNQKTHLQGLFSLADLLIKINPMKYPAFAFAWLELITHKTFMPEFLSIAPSQLMSAQGGNAAQGNKKGGAVQAQLQVPQQQQSNDYFQKWFKFKELVVHLFLFLKGNMIVGQPMSEPLAKFYEATLRIILIIKNDCPEFLCDFHFNFVNSLPEHCLQLRNIILSAQPKSIQFNDPFSKNLKVDTLDEIKLPPRNQSNYENYLSFMNLREDLEKYFKTNDKSIVQVIVDKLKLSEENVNGQKRINSSIFNAVALYIQNCAHQSNSKQKSLQKECYEILKQIIQQLTPETRMCLLNSIVNELRYINSHTYFYSWMVLYLYNDIAEESVQEQITRILIERLQTHEPHPWGLCITFRELLQNPKYGFAKKSFVVRNQATIEQLMQTKLSKFNQIWVNNKQVLQNQANNVQYSSNVSTPNTSQISDYSLKFNTDLC